MVYVWREAVQPSSQNNPSDVYREVDLRQAVSVHRQKDERGSLGQAQATETASHDAWMEMNWNFKRHPFEKQLRHSRLEPS